MPPPPGYDPDEFEGTPCEVCQERGLMPPPEGWTEYNT